MDDGNEEDPSLAFGLSRELVNTATKRHLSPSGGGVFSTPPPFTGSGWSKQLLRASHQKETAIASLEGLEHSIEFQAHLREKKEAATYMSRVNDTLQAQKALRLANPTAFRQLWSRTDIQEYETVEAPIRRLLAEYYLTLATTLAVALWAWLGHVAPLFRLLPVAVWLVLQVSSWSRGSRSPWGRLLGLFLVRGDGDDEEQPQEVQGLLGGALTHLVELLYLASTCGLGVLTSTFLMLVPPHRPAGQHLLGLTSVWETSTPVHLG